MAKVSKGDYVKINGEVKYGFVTNDDGGVKVKLLSNGEVDVDAKDIILVEKSIVSQLDDRFENVTVSKENIECEVKAKCKAKENKLAVEETLKQIESWFSEKGFPDHKINASIQSDKVLLTSYGGILKLFYCDVDFCNKLKMFLEQAIEKHLVKIKEDQLRKELEGES